MLEGLVAEVPVLPVSAIEEMSSRDSARLAARLARVADAIPSDDTSTDFRGLTKLRDVMGSKFKAGVLLYDGERCLSFGDRLHAVPLRLLWETS